MVVATIAFPFDSSDRSFAEELGRKAPVLKAVAVSVLSSKKAAELAPAFEGALKAALRDAFNARLSLGKVTEILALGFRGYSVIYPKYSVVVSRAETQKAQRNPV